MEVHKKKVNCTLRMLFLWLVLCPSLSIVTTYEYFMISTIFTLELNKMLSQICILPRDLNE